MFKETAAALRKGIGTEMKRITARQWDSALFNLDSMRAKLLNEQYEQPEREEELQSRIDEIENFLTKMYFGEIKVSDWVRIQEIVNERQMQRYITCVNSGMNEKTAAGAFDD